MKRIPLLFLCLTLAGCSVAAARSIHTVNGQSFSVTLDESYMWPSSVAMTGSDGETYMIDAFPLVTAIVVTRQDGTPLVDADKSNALTAAEAYCTEKGQGKPATQARLANGAWAFGGCGATG